MDVRDRVWHEERPAASQKAPQVATSPEQGAKEGRGPALKAPGRAQGLSRPLLIFASGGLCCDSMRPARCDQRQLFLPVAEDGIGRFMGDGGSV